MMRLVRLLAAGSSFAFVYDPKNGENVSTFIGMCLSLNGKL